MKTTKIATIVATTIMVITIFLYSTVTAFALSTPHISKLENTRTGINISWNKISGASKYRVFVKTSGGWKTIANTSSTNFTYTSVKNNTPYTFTVRCLSKDGKSYTSSYEKSGSTSRFFSVPVLKSTENVEEGIKFTWNSVQGASKYRVYHKVGNGGWVNLCDTKSTSYIDTDVKSGQTYTYTVRCISEDSKAFESSFNATGLKRTYLSTPHISKLENTRTGINISWNKISGASKYRVFVKTSGGWKTIANTSSTSFTYTSVKNNTPYTFTVRCLSKDGKSYTSSYEKSGSTSRFFSVPVLKSTENVEEGIKFTWNSVQGASKYRVYHKVGNGGWVNLCDTKSTSYIDTDVKSGQTYTYTVRCISEDSKAFESSFNATGIGRCFLCVPSISDIRIKNNKLQLVWDSVQGASAYTVYEKTTSGWKNIGTTYSNNFTYSPSLKEKYIIDQEKYTRRRMFKLWSDYHNDYYYLVADETVPERGHHEDSNVQTKVFTVRATTSNDSSAYNTNGYTVSLQKTWVLEREAYEYENLNDPIIVEHCRAICNLCGEDITGNQSDGKVGDYDPEYADWDFIKYHFFIEGCKCGWWHTETRYFEEGYYTIYVPEVGHYELRFV